MAGLIQFTNNAATLLASSITSGDTSLTVSAATGSLFPTLAGGQYFYCTLTNAAATVIEIVKVTARSTDTFTIVKGLYYTRIYLTGGIQGKMLTAGEQIVLRHKNITGTNYTSTSGDNIDWAIRRVG